MPNNKKKSHAAAPANKIIVHQHDVLNGRGVNIAYHPGNLRFRALVKSHADQSYCSDYSTSAKKALAEGIIRHIQNLDPPGRFLRRPARSKKASDVDSGTWEEVPFRETLKKTCQALRDCNRGDRTEYARHIEPPQDVQASLQERQQTGLSQREYAEQIASSVLTRGTVTLPGAQPRMDLHVDTTAMATTTSMTGPPEPANSFHSAASSQQQPVVTPATTASSMGASTSGSFHYFQDHSPTDDIGGGFPDHHHHGVPAAAPFGYNEHYTNSPVHTQGVELDPFHLEEEQKLAAMARESTIFDDDFDDGSHEPDRPLDEGTDFTTVFDGDVTI